MGLRVFSVHSLVATFSAPTLLALSQERRGRPLRRVSFGDTEYQEPDEEFGRLLEVSSLG